MKLPVVSGEKAIKAFLNAGFVKVRQTDFPNMYIDMQPVVERMQPEESLEDFVG